MPEPLPLALYVHFPWCVRKCPYCDFNSHAQRGPIPERAYLRALLADLERDLPQVWGRRLHSVFVGGGTPSLLSPEGVAELLSGVRARLTMLPGTEVTLEANPGTVDGARLRGYREAGVNRLSIGVQSFDDAALRAIGRIHDGGEALRAVELAQEVGFERVNVDLMYGLPGQTREGALRDLRIAVEAGPGHISHYQLTLEPNTPFYRDPPRLPDDERLWAMQEASREALGAAGYGHYEVSAYAREGQRCRHNLNYWEFGDYLGIGAGAHAKLTLRDPLRVVRQSRTRHPRAYLDGDATLAEVRELEPADLVLELMMNALRLAEGVPVEYFEQRTGLSAGVLEAPLREARERGLLVADPRWLRATALGRRFLNDLLTLFVPEP